MLLGVGGVRALHALGIEPGVMHLNEGHAALAPVELALPRSCTGEALAGRARGGPRATPCSRPTRPVPAGNDTYPAEQARRAFELLVQHSSIARGRADRARSDRTPRTPSEPFGVTQAALRMTRAANGVSRRHGEVAREMWTSLWPELPVEEVPIGYVTNGVHVPTWIGTPMRELLDRHLGEDWLTRAADPEDLGGRRSDPRRGAVGGPQRQRADLVETRRARAAPPSGCCAAMLASTCDAAAEHVRRRRAHDRVRAAGGDLQAPGSADA